MRLLCKRQAEALQYNITQHEKGVHNSCSAQISESIWEPPVY